MFYGLCESKCTFSECCHNSSAFDPFSILSLPLPKEVIEAVTLTGMMTWKISVYAFLWLLIFYFKFLFVWNICCTVVPRCGAVPEVVQIESDKTIDFEFVRKEIASRYGCSSNKVFFVRRNGATFEASLRIAQNEYIHLY